MALSEPSIQLGHGSVDITMDVCARVLHKQERQGKYPAAFVYGSRSQT